MFINSCSYSFLTYLDKFSKWLISNQLTLNINKKKFFNIGSNVKKLVFINIQGKLIRYEPRTKFIWVG